MVDSFLRRFDSFIQYYDANPDRIVFATGPPPLHLDAAAAPTFARR